MAQRVRHEAIKAAHVLDHQLNREDVPVVLGGLGHGELIRPDDAAHGQVALTQDAG